MADQNEYMQRLASALKTKGDWLEKEEIPKLKEDLRGFHNAFYSLYKLFLKRKLINEDPYKQEAKVTEIKVPPTSAFPDNERVENLTVRLAEFDNQLDFLTNFYQLSLESLPLDKIKIILGLVKYIDWVHFVPDGNATSNTTGMIELMNQVKVGADQIATSIINESINALNKNTATVLKYLKELSDYDREAYKYELREKVTSTMQGQEASQAGLIKKKFSSAMPGKPFYPDLVEEVIKEDFAKDGAELRERVLKNLGFTDQKPKTEKKQVSYKTLLVEGLLAIGSTVGPLQEISPKLDENKELLESQKTGFLVKVKKLIAQVFNKEPEETVYDVEYLDSAKGVTVKEKVAFNTLKTDMDRRIKNLSGLTLKNAQRLEAMEEAQLLGALERNIREVQSLHKTLSALDDYFKAAAGQEIRDKVRGIKPELGTVKNAIVKANQKRYEFSAQKEEEEQFKRLGITTGST